MNRYPLFRWENIPAYLAVMGAWAIISIASAVILYIATRLPFWEGLVWAAVTSMCGMAIMFVASVINLRKLGPGFQRLAEGERDPRIPPVWCPVLTAATNAAMELASRQGDQNQQSTSTLG